jgi:cell division protease FtsH
MMPVQRSSRQPHKSARWSELSGIAFALVFLLLAALQFMSLQDSTTEVAYSDFKQLVAEKQLNNLEVTPTRIRGTLRMPGAASFLPASDAAAAKTRGEPWRFTTTRVADDSLADSLFAAGIRYRATSTAPGRACCFRGRYRSWHSSSCGT